MPRVSVRLPLLVLALAACRDPAPPPVDAGAPSPAPTTTAPTTPPPEPAPVDAGPPPPPDWSALNVHELKALDHYRGFSADGLLYAYTEHSAGAGVPVLAFVATTTNTIERTVPLASKQAREEVAADLAEERFPKPGVKQEVPGIVRVELREGLVQVLFSGMPAAQPFRPWGGQAGLKPTGVEVVALSRDGKKAAIRITGSGGGEFGAPPDHRVVTLFE